MSTSENEKGGSILKGRVEGIEKTGPPKHVGRRLTIDAAKRDAANCWEAALLEPLLIPSESPVLKAMRVAGQQYHGEVQTADAQRKKRSGTAAHPRIRGSSEGGMGLSGSSDAATRHGPGFDGL